MSLGVLLRFTPFISCLVISLVRSFVLPICPSWFLSYVFVCVCLSVVIRSLCISLVRHFVLPFARYVVRAVFLHVVRSLCRYICLSYVCRS